MSDQIIKMNVESLSLQEIRRLLSVLPAEEEKRKLEDIGETRESIETILLEKGYSIADVYPEFKPKKTRSKPALKARYANPDNSSETWTGKGRKPAWVVSNLNAGMVMGDLLIK